MLTVSKSKVIYGYIIPDNNSKKINDRYETSKGIVYFNDGKTTCKIGTTVLDVTLGVLSQEYLVNVLMEFISW